MTAAVEELVARMEGLLDPLQAGGDPARFFLGTYLRTTRAVGEALDTGLRRCRVRPPAGPADQRPRRPA